MRETGTLPYSFVFSMQNRFSGVFRTPEMAGGFPGGL